MAAGADVARLLHPVLRALGRQDWLRYGLRGRILHAFAHPDTVSPQPFEVDFFGHRFCGDLSSRLDWFVYFYGAYEKPILFLLRDLVAGREDAIFLDVGANVGQHSLFMSRYCAQVHAFEPYGPIRERLEAHLSLNAVTNVVVHDVGLGAHTAELEYYAPTGRNVGKGSFVQAHAPQESRPAGTLRVANGDEYLQACGLTRIDAIKIDVEGFEKAVLQGLAETLRAYRPAVVLEMTRTTRASFASAADVLALFPPGYELLAIVPRFPRLGVFNREAYGLRPFDFMDIGYPNILARPT